MHSPLKVAKTCIQSGEHKRLLMDPKVSIKLNATSITVYKGPVLQGFLFEGWEGAYRVSYLSAGEGAAGFPL